jgi:DNA-binding HxlR family transcriptional regulator
MMNEMDPGIRPYDYFHMVMGGKWKPFIVRGIILKGVIRFNETMRVLGVSAKVLKQQLSELERDGIITRTIYPEVPLRVEYRLTPAGEKLKPVFDLIYHWSLEQLQGRNADIAPLTFIFHPEPRAEDKTTT